MVIDLFIGIGMLIAVITILLYGIFTTGNEKTFITQRYLKKLNKNQTKENQRK